MVWAHPPDTPTLCATIGLPNKHHKLSPPIRWLSVVARSCAGVRGLIGKAGTGTLAGPRDGQKAGVAQILTTTEMAARSSTRLAWAYRSQPNSPGYG